LHRLLSWVWTVEVRNDRLTAESASKKLLTVQNPNQD
jgi:hypothetical protein